MPLGRSATAKRMPLAACPAGAPLRPMYRSVVVSATVNSRAPSCSSWSDCFDMAPASSHPSHPSVFVSELPVTVSRAALIHTTSAPPGVDGPGAGGGTSGAGAGGGSLEAGGAGTPATSNWEGTFTTNASSRLDPTLLVQ